jgi:DNA-binding response OmpR family regulator
MQTVNCNCLDRRVWDGPARRDSFLIMECDDDGSLFVDFDKRRVAVDGKTVDLRPRDFDVLTVLISHRGQALSSEQLIDLAWDDRSWVARDRMRYALARLKYDLGWTGQNGPIETIRGVGYRYCSPSEQRAPTGECPVR